MTISNSPALPPDANDVHLRTDHLRSDLGVRSARGGAITLTAQIAKFVIQIGSTMILARLLTPAAYGLLAMIAVLTGFISLFRDVGLSSATVQRSDISHREVSTLFWINVGLGLVTMSIAMAAAPLLARFYQEPRVTPVTIALALTFFINGFAVQHQALLQRRMRFGALAAIEITATLASAAVAIEFARRGYGYWSLVFAQFATTLVGLAGVWVACDWRPQRPADLASVRDLVRFGRNLTGFHVVNYLSRHIDNALIGRFWGAAQLGLYDKAYQLLLLPINQISGPITAVALPALSRLADEPDAYRRAYIRILEKVVLLTTPGVILMLFVADWMVHIILGPDWTGVTPIFILLGLSAPVLAICDTTGWLFVSQGRTADMFRWGLAGSALLISGIAAGLPWGTTGVAAGFSFTVLFLMAPALFWYVTRRGPVKQSDIYLTGAPIFGATAVMAIALTILRYSWPSLTPLPGLVSAGLTGAVVFLVTLYLIPRGRHILVETISVGLTLKGESLASGK